MRFGAGVHADTPEDSGSDLDPECLLDVMLVDLDELRTVDWDALGYGCRPFIDPSTQTRKKARVSTRKQVARAA